MIRLVTLGLLLVLVFACTQSRAPDPVVERPQAIGEIVAMLRPSKEEHAVLVKITRDPGDQELVVFDQENGLLAGKLRRLDRKRDVLHCEVSQWGKGAMLRVGAPVYPASEGHYPVVPASAPPVRHEPGHDPAAVVVAPTPQRPVTADPAMQSAAKQAAERAAAFKAQQAQQAKVKAEAGDPPQASPPVVPATTDGSSEELPSEHAGE